MSEPEWYCTEDGDSVFVPVTTGWNEAQRLASEATREIGDNWSHASFVARKPVTLHIGCDWPYGCNDYGEDTDPPRHPLTDCYVFETVEGRYRG